MHKSQLWKVDMCSPSAIMDINEKHKRFRQKQTSYNITLLSEIDLWRCKWGLKKEKNCRHNKIDQNETNIWLVGN